MESANMPEDWYKTVNGVDEVDSLYLARKTKYQYKTVCLRLRGPMIH